MPADKNHEVLINIIAGIIIFISLTALIIFVLLFYQKKRFLHKKKLLEMEKQYREELLQTQLETQESTFYQISQELHDNIGQLLSSTKLLIGITKMGIEQNDFTYVPDTISTAEQTLSKAIQDLRSLSKSLNKEWLHQFNLVENLEEEIKRINAARNIQAELLTQYEKLPLEPEAQVMLFRVVQEALQNSIKHAFPKHIVIQIKNTDHHFELSIEDDGRGFDIDAAKKESLGLRNMEHRIKLLGGTIEWKTAEIKGTAVLITIPVKEQPV